MRGLRKRLRRLEERLGRSDLPLHLTVQVVGGSALSGPSYNFHRAKVTYADKSTDVVRGESEPLGRFEQRVHDARPAIGPSTIVFMEAYDDSTLRSE
jgi:hypothetical protein